VKNCTVDVKLVLKKHVYVVAMTAFCWRGSLVDNSQVMVLRLEDDTVTEKAVIPRLPTKLPRGEGNLTVIPWER